MKRMNLAALIFGLTLANAVAEVPEIIVTPTDADRQDVVFSVSVEVRPSNRVARVWLKITKSTGKYETIGHPGLYLSSGSNFIGNVALHPGDANSKTNMTYWCDLAGDCLQSSSISIPCRSSRGAGAEGCATGAEYILKLKDFIKNR